VLQLRVCTKNIVFRFNSIAVLQEVELLKKAVKEFGVGSWSKMKNKYKFQNPDRTELQLKDKVRNLIKTGKLQVPEKNDGKRSSRSAANGSEFDL
jgi:hypothetical protein